MTSPISSNSELPAKPLNLENDWGFFAKVGAGVHEEPARTAWMLQLGGRVEYGILPQLRIFTELNFSRSLKYFTATASFVAAYDNPELLKNYEQNKDNELISNYRKAIEGLRDPNHDVFVEHLRAISLKKGVRKGDDSLYCLDIPLGLNVDGYLSHHLSLDIFSGLSMSFTRQSELIMGIMPKAYKINEETSPTNTDNSVFQKEGRYYHTWVSWDSPHDNDIDLLKESQPRDQVFMSPLFGAGARWMTDKSGGLNLRASWAGNRFQTSLWLEYEI
ncbi:MAG: hypothetical protein ACD_73C00611G0002 [uncultured bacterium]|nr:MAG: hypothetical protein ACD_73C00611G0002 [uncultured bacterium]